MNPINAIQNLLNGEINKFQQRLQRCAMDCQDEARDKFPSLETNQKAMEQATSFATGCVSKCADKHIAMLPALQTKLEQDIDRIHD